MGGSGVVSVGGRYARAVSLEGALGLAPVLVVGLLGGLVAGCSDSPGVGCATGVVETTSGAVCGTVEEVIDLGGEPVDAFRGIPFAETTAGDNRWRPPVPKARMAGVFDATESSLACPQKIDPPFGPTNGTSEDCLTVNVWRPLGARAGEPLPVLVWIYGGSFTNGGTSVRTYDGGYIAAQQDVVVVTLNYRLGALGFLSGISGLTGNYGLQDQQLAFHWVRDNVAAFGGNPDEVTIFGESAGAMSVGLHALSVPSSDGLFRGALMESNPLGIPYKTIAQAAPTAAAFAADLGCAGGDLDCLRAVPADQIVTAQANAELQFQSLVGGKLAGFLVFAPVIDGGFLDTDPTIAAQQGKLTLPTLLGTNHDEGTIFVAEIAQLVGGTVTEKAYETVLTLLFGAANVPQIIALYGINPTDNFDNLSRVTNDYLFGCPNRFVARQARSGIYVYEFDETSLNVWQGVVPQCDNEACHGDEVPFVFHADRQIGIEFTAEQAQLSDEIVGYWGTFAHRLDPNATGFFPWPGFTPNGLEYLILNTPALSTAVNPIANCDFWDQIGYNLGAPVAALNAMAGR